MWLHLIGEKTIGHMYKVWRTSTDDTKALRSVRRIFRLNDRFIYPLLRGLNKLLGAHVITSGLGLPFHKPRYEEDIFPLATLPFEGIPFPVPHDYDHHLRLLFGDYMRLPDLDKLQPHVGKLEIW